MPARRIPTAIQEAKGAYKKDPKRGRARANEPVITDPIGDPPACFFPIIPAIDEDLDDAEQNLALKVRFAYEAQQCERLRDLWHELIADAAPGVLNRSHRWHLESACRLKYKERFGEPKTGDYTNLNKFLTQMGMNPAAQSTVSGAKPGPSAENVFSRLAQGTKGRT